MMDDLKRMAVFATVIEQGSMSAAARQLGTTPSAVSQQVRALERRGGVTLLHRSTRKLALTEAGARFHAHCEALLAAARQAQRLLDAARDAPEGELRVAAPVGFARHVAPALGPLLADHPALNLRLLVDDRLIDLIHERIDLALRFGKLPDSTWAARRLAAFDWMVCAAPDYLRRRGTPARPEDLLAHQWLAFARDGNALRLDLAGPQGGQHSLRVEARIVSNNQLSLQQMCAAGLGLATLARVDADDDLRSGRLVPVLPQWRLAPIAVWAVTPQRDAQPAKVRHAVAALQAYLQAAPGAVD